MIPNHDSDEWFIYRFFFCIWHSKFKSLDFVQQYKYVGILLDEHLKYDKCHSFFTRSGGRALSPLVAKYNILIIILTIIYLLICFMHVCLQCCYMVVKRTRTNVTRYSLELVFLVYREIWDRFLFLLIGAYIWRDSGIIKMHLSRLTKICFCEIINYIEITGPLTQK